MSVRKKERGQSASALDTGEPLKSLWANVEANWDDEAAHALFLEQSIRLEQVAFAVAMYRRRDDQVARQQIDRITARLIEMLSRSPNGRRGIGKRSRSLVGGLALLFGLLLVLIILWLIL